jgi:hypothetical protein
VLGYFKSCNVRTDQTQLPDSEESAPRLSKAPVATDACEGPNNRDAATVFSSSPLLASFVVKGVFVFFDFSLLFLSLSSPN